MKDPKYLNPLINYEVFFKNIKKGDIIEYSMSYDPYKAIKICKDYGFTVKCCKPESREYKLFGCMCVKVTGHWPPHDPIKTEPVKVIYFNPEELVL